MGNRTTINIRREIREMLNKRKEYKRETYDEVLEKLLGKGLKEARKLPK
jgi:predicted CopG family antitoxin